MSLRHPPRAGAGGGQGVYHDAQLGFTGYGARSGGGTRTGLRAAGGSAAAQAEPSRGRARTRGGWADEGSLGSYEGACCSPAPAAGRC